MSAVQYRFKSRADLLRHDGNKRVLAALSEAAAVFDGSEVERRTLTVALAEAQRVVHRQTLADSPEFFVMLTPSQNRFVVGWLSTTSRYPKVGPHLWAWLIEWLDPAGTGEILMRRDALIERLGCSGRAVDAVLRELVDLQALSRLREPEPGKQGRGTVRYFLNPRVGSCSIPKGERAARIAAAPLLRSVDGSVHPSQRRSRAPTVEPVVL